MSCVLPSLTACLLPALRAADASRLAHRIAREASPTHAHAHASRVRRKLVSNVAPVYYADLTANQAHFMVSDFRDDEVMQFDARSTRR